MIQRRIVTSFLLVFPLLVAAVSILKSTSLFSYSPWIIGNDSHGHFTLPKKESTASAENNTKATTSNNNSFVVEVLIIGSLTRPEYMETIQQTWASHVSVRNFWTATEVNDVNPECQNMTTERVLQVARQCRSMRPSNSSQIARHFQVNFANPAWLLKKANPSGWLCAQSRMPYSLAQTMQHYSKMQPPDYLILIDDDSYINLEWFQQLHVQKDSDIPVVSAGCMIRSPVHIINWTLPFGGWGMFYSCGAIQRMLQPLYCNNNHSANADDDDFERKACRRLEDNFISEKDFWKPGMSVNDLMGAVASQRDPFCLHSDWATAYFVNYYFISNHVDEPFYRNVEQSRLHMLDNSEIYGGKKLTGNCRHVGAQVDLRPDKDILCNKHSHICHYVKPDEMRQISEAIISQFPEKYVVTKK